MKRVLVFLISISFIFSNLTAFAASQVSFNTSDCETPKNRLFNVDVYAVSDTPLCAALFEVSYDSSAFEFRGASAEKPALIESNEENGIIRLDYLNSDGADCSYDTVLFTLSFKSLKEGKYTFGYTVSQCVDNEAHFMSVGEVRSGEIAVTGSSASSESKSSKSSQSSSSGSKSSKSSSSGSKSSKSSSSGSKSKSTTDRKSKSASSETDDDTEEEPLLDFGILNNSDDNNGSGINLIAVAVLCAACMAFSAAAVLGVLKLRSVINARKKDLKTDDSQKDE